MPQIKRSDEAAGLSAVGDETKEFSLMGSEPNRQDTGLIQIDTGLGASGNLSLALYVRVDHEAQWALEPQAMANLAFNSNFVFRVPKYPYAKVVVVATGDPSAVTKVFAR